MSRRTAFSRSPRLRAGILVALALALGAGTALPAGAQDDISISPDRVIVDEPGTTLTVATETVADDLVGRSCDLRVVASNGQSIHPGNLLRVTTGDSIALVNGVEDVADGSVVDARTVELGATIVVELTLGPDGISSLGFSVGFDCPEEASSSTPTVLPSQQEAPLLPQSPPAAAAVGDPNYTG